MSMTAMNESTVLFSRGKNTGASSGADCSSDASDIWDDTLLVEAYDKAVKTVKQGHCPPAEATAAGKGKKGKKKGGENQWKVGDKCRCQYSSDLKYYEADIIELDASTGTCTVKYVGYENEEETAIANLRQSNGDNARMKQAMEACSNNDGYAEGNLPKKRNSFKKMNGMSRPNDWNSFVPRPSEEFGNFSLQGSHSIVPPPPPPNLFRNICEDEAETEAMSAMLISWYMSGYHTGYYQGLKMAKKNSRKS